MPMNTPFSEKIIRDFQPDTHLASSLPNYVYREEQVKLAGEIAECMESGGQLLAEAETGTGKTLAYLVPALRCDLKVLISTHTKALQDQLMFRDIPAVQDALGVKRSIALLKGRGNYLCPHRLEKTLTDATLEKWAKKLLLKVLKWGETSRDGDLSALPFDPFTRGIGGMVTATAEQCLGGKCPVFSRCPLFRARQVAQDADIVVSNHSLLLADAELKAGEFGEVLPDFDCTIVDEAHSIPELACRHFGRQVGLNRLTGWTNDTQALLTEFGDEESLKKKIDRYFMKVLQAYTDDNLDEALAEWQVLIQHMESRRKRSEDAEKIADRALEIAADMQSMLEPSEGFVAWREGSGKYAKHLLAPVETGPVLSEKLWSRPSSFILSSATLRISGDFTYMQERLGLEEAQAVFHPSPFDYTSQAMIYAPRHIPAPNEANYEETLFEEMETLIRASSGRAFVLFTSHQMLRRISPRLSGSLPWPVLVQDESGSRDAILHQFRLDTHSVLCGTRSFWEGVDVPGETLSLVIIDKMPFAPPDDRLLEARRKRCEEKGGNGFFDIQLPEAIAILRQGAGRLIRSQDDRGVIAILDSRLYRKSYGRIVARNLPPAPKTEDIADIQRFFAVHP